MGEVPKNQDKEITLHRLRWDEKNKAEYRKSIFAVLGLDPDVKPSAPEIHADAAPQEEGTDADVGTV